jgi:hypothetical protein
MDLTDSESIQNGRIRAPRTRGPNSVVGRTFREAQRLGAVREHRREALLQLESTCFHLSQMKEKIGLDASISRDQLFELLKKDVIRQG